MNKVCSNCKTEYSTMQHYCKVCGNNLSNQIEKSDVILFFHRFTMFLGVFSLIFFIFMLQMASCSCDGAMGGKLTIYDYLFLLIPILFITLSVVLKKKYKDTIIKNIKKE